MMPEFYAGFTGRAKETPCHLPMTYGQANGKGIVVSESPAFMEMTPIPLGARSALPGETLRNGNTEPKATIATHANAKGQIPNTEPSPDCKRDGEAGLVLIARPRLSSLVPFLILERPNVLSLRLCLLIFSRRDIPPCGYTMSGCHSSCYAHLGLEPLMK